MHTIKIINRVNRIVLPLLAFALICSMTAYATADDAQTVINEWGEAIGGAKALAAIEDFYLVYNMEAAGLSGTLEVWQKADGRRRIEIKLGEVFSHTNVFDGTASFSSDNGGKFQEIAGMDFSTVVSYAYVESFSAFLTDRMQPFRAPSIEIADGVTVCTLIPVDGFAMRYYLSENYLPDSMINASDGNRTVVHYSQWKTENGVMWPHQHLLTTGDTRFDETYTLQSVETNLGLSDSLFVRPPERMSKARFPEGVGRVDLPMELFGNHIFVPVKVNGNDSTLWFIFDTGAAVSVLNKDRIAHLGIQTAGAARGHGVGEGSVEVSFATGVSIDLGGVIIDDLNVAAISLDNFSKMLGRRFDGIIGGDVISEITTRIDYRDSMITIYSRGEFSPPPNAKALNVSFEGGIPYIEASVRTFDGTQAQCRLYLDTGKRAGISIYHHFAEVNRLIGDDIPFVEAPSGYGVGGQTTAKFVRVPEFSLGGSTIENALVAVELGSESRDSANYEQGAIGGDCLKNFTLTIDYSGETVWIEKAYETAQPGELDMFGVTLAENKVGGKSSGFEIITVLSGSPADAAGLAVGDNITVINGVAASDYTLPAAIDLFKSGDGRELILEITRGGQQHTVTVALKRMI